MNEVAGILHGPHLPTAGVAARLAFHGDYLRIWTDGGSIEDVAVEDIEVGVTGFNDDTLQLSWRKLGELRAVTIEDRPAQQTLSAGAPDSLKPRLKRGHSAMRYHRGKWQAVVGVLAALVMLVGVAWWQSEAITAWMAQRVSMETEIALGERALAQLDTAHELTQEGLAATTLADIGARLTTGSQYEYRWYVSDDPAVNAYALPGGIIIVNSGMFEAAASADELAGVLAHEVQHIEHRHSLQQMIHAAGWAAVLAVVLGDVSAITAIVVHQLGNLRNSRKLEAEADTHGMRALARAGIPLQGMASLFRRLQSEDEQRGGEGVALLSSHPATAERIASLDHLANSLPCDCQPLKLDWAAVQESLGPARGKK